MSVVAAGWGLGGQPLAAGLGLSWGLGGSHWLGLGQPAPQTGLEATLAWKLGSWGWVSRPTRQNRRFGGLGAIP